jgi:hypothetical protein
MQSVYKMVKGFVKEAVEYAKQGAPHVTAKQYESRLTACTNCPHLKKDVERCGLCGCLVEHKAKWATATCPDKPPRWEPIKVGQGGKKIKLKRNGGESNTTDTSNQVQPPNSES